MKLRTIAGESDFLGRLSNLWLVFHFFIGKGAGGVGGVYVVVRFVETLRSMLEGLIPDGDTGIFH